MWIYRLQLSHLYVSCHGEREEVLHHITWHMDIRDKFNDVTHIILETKRSRS
jgi:hypothetical protein